MTSPIPEWTRPQYKRQKVRNQVKSRFYYLFWGAATVSVFAGQLYVGSGYRMFARSLNRIPRMQIHMDMDLANHHFIDFNVTK